MSPEKSENQKPPRRRQPKAKKLKTSKTDLVKKAIAAAREEFTERLIKLP